MRLKKRGFYLATPMALVLLLVVLLIILSVFFGLRDSGLFGRVENTTGDLFGSVVIGSKDIPVLNIDVPEKIDADFQKVTAAFTASEGTRECYNTFGALKGFEELKDLNFQIYFGQTQKGTLIILQKADKGAVVNVKGKRIEIDGIFPCTISGKDSKDEFIAWNFIKKYKSDTDKAGFSPHFKRNVFVVSSSTIGDLSANYNMFFKPSGDLTCFIPYDTSCAGDICDKAQIMDGPEELPFVLNQKDKHYKKIGPCSERVPGVIYTEGRNTYLIEDIQTDVVDKQGNSWMFVLERGILFNVSLGSEDVLKSLNENKDAIKSKFVEFLKTLGKENVKFLNESEYEDFLKTISGMVDTEDISRVVYYGTPELFRKNVFYLCGSARWGNIAYCTNDYNVCLSYMTKQPTDKWKIINSFPNSDQCKAAISKLSRGSKYYGVCYFPAGYLRCLEAQKCLDEGGDLRYSKIHTGEESCEEEKKKWSEVIR